jgi:hypothetical protein
MTTSTRQTKAFRDYLLYLLKGYVKWTILIGLNTNTYRIQTDISWNSSVKVQLTLYRWSF